MIDIDMAAGPGENTTPSTTKLAAMLRLFRQGRRLNRFEAEHHHDHCLHSTVSTLKALGIVIERRWESVPCLGGKARVRCKRYWLQLTVENLKRADDLLATWGTP